MKPTPAQWKNALARIAGGVSDCRGEADRLKVDIRSVERRVSTARRRGELPPEPPSPPPAPSTAPSPSLSPPEVAPPGAAAAPSGELERARTAAGLITPSPVITTDDVKAARDGAIAEDEAYCVAQVLEMKCAIVTVAGLAAGLDAFDARLEKLGRLSPGAEEAARRSSPTLAPILKRYVEKGGLWALGVALLLDGLFTARDLVRIVRAERGRSARMVEADEPPRPENP